ncbi:MAG: helicase-related protein [Bacillota bacterium]|nr:helicase-related protein [Bacillota bacterium]
MVGALYFVYVARTLRESGSPLVGVSHYPLLDLVVLAEEGYEHLTVAKGPLPLALAEREARRVAGRVEARSGTVPAALGHPREAGPTEAQPQEPAATGLTGGPWRRLLHLRNALRAFVARKCPPHSRMQDRHRTAEPASLHPGTSARARSATVTVRDCSTVEVPSQEDLDAIRDVLEGRILFDYEIRRALEERGRPVAGPLEDALQVLIVRGLVGRAPSVTIDRFGMATCARCGGRDIVEASCASCGSDECLRCVECVSMGEARSCRPLYYAPGRARAPGAEHPGAAGLGPAAADAATGAAPAMESGAAPGAAIEAPAVPPVSGLVEVAFAAPAEAHFHTPPPAAHPARVALPEHQERPEWVERPESPQRPERPERPERLDLQGNPVPAWEITLPFELTNEQQDASRFLASFVVEDERSECLVYAVCGAGKTEVCFSAIALTLQRGGRALFAVPRSDVVAEVAPRISAAMPGARVIALRGASRERYRDADIVVATTHQVLRFYQAFDLAVLDEADAFPFRGSRMLRHALRRATAPGGKTVYVTATPDPSLVAAADRGDVALVRISARHHGHPLPVPSVITAKLPPVEDHGALSRLSQPRTTPGRRPAPGLPPEVVAVIETSIRAGHGVFVFVPTIDLAGRVCAMLEASLASVERRGPLSPASPPSLPAPPRVAFVHSRHPERDQLREAFKEGHIDVLVTTTIMERGITVPMADVVVLYADFERVFDAGALVQMAGRAGRSREYPCARVYFAAERTSPAMRAAIASIRAMNRHAADSGYLMPGDAQGPQMRPVGPDADSPSEARSHMPSRYTPPCGPYPRRRCTRGGPHIFRTPLEDSDPLHRKFTTR